MMHACMHAYMVTYAWTNAHTHTHTHTRARVHARAVYAIKLYDSGRHSLTCALHYHLTPQYIQHIRSSYTVSFTGRVTQRGIYQAWQNMTDIQTSISNIDAQYVPFATSGKCHVG